MKRKSVGLRRIDHSRVGSTSMLAMILRHLRNIGKSGGINKMMLSEQYFLNLENLKRKVEGEIRERKAKAEEKTREYVADQLERAAARLTERADRLRSQGITRVESTTGLSPGRAGR